MTDNKKADVKNKYVETENEYYDRLAAEYHVDDDLIAALMTERTVLA